MYEWKELDSLEGTWGPPWGRGFVRRVGHIHKGGTKTFFGVARPVPSLKCATEGKKK